MCCWLMGVFVSLRTTLIKAYGLHTAPGTAARSVQTESRVPAVKV